MDSNNFDLYCKFYVKTNLSLDDLMDFIFSQTGGKKNHFTIYTDIMIIGALKNSDKRNNDEFLYWPYLLDVEPVDEDITEYVPFVNAAKELNNALRSHGISTVVSCDFEYEFE